MRSAASSLLKEAIFLNLWYTSTDRLAIHSLEGRQIRREACENRESDVGLACQRLRKLVDGNLNLTKLRVRACRKKSSLSACLTLFTPRVGLVSL